ncbi:hypothetical protein ZHAS_00004778 [Anopheles sinensis]|uniref:Uncharacterized protein n=1 Tax=Anopheles sinensis TaxID=74873 RepID=A0A084VHV2_ANOSI|nr:hypothetical protein ZHAS_00004778 [Anopheles sinensis]
MVSDSKHKLISEFFIPDELKDDIAYCQRSLRDYVKVHQQAQVQGFLRELEDEMLAIGKDQSELVQDLTKRLRHFQRKTATERSVELEDDLANGYVAWVLSTHCELQGAQSYVPRAVSERLNESQLYQKYRLVDVGRNVSVLPDKRLRKRPVLQTSLLKPLAERTVDPGAQNHPKPFLTPSSSQAILPPLAPPAVVKVPPVSATASKRKVPPEQPPIHVKMLRSRTSTVKQEETPIKREPIEQGHEPANDSEESSPNSSNGAMSDSAAVKRGRCNLRQALSKVTKSNQHQVSPPTSTSKPTASRSNRPQPGGTLPSSPSTGKRSPSLPSSSSESSNSRASTPGVRKPPDVASDDSSNEHLLPLIEEDHPPTLPCTIDQMDQYAFLRPLGLYTIADSNLLKGRKNERKRRSCYSTERKDYHYGKLDYFEQQQLYIMPKRRPGANKRLLYTATTAEKANKNRSNPWSNGASATLPPPPPPPLLPPSLVVALTSTVVTEQSLSETVATEAPNQTVDNALEEPKNGVCCVCTKVGKYRF